MRGSGVDHGMPTKQPLSPPLLDVDSPAAGGQLRQGAVVGSFQVETLAHGTRAIPAPVGLTHLQFRRFAGCPICHVHLRSVARRHAELVAAGITEVAFFHSDRAEMQAYQQALPFAVIADGQRRYYKAFGVERSWRSLLHPRTMVQAMRGMWAATPSAEAGGATNPMAGAGDPNGLPADFLLDAHGVVVAAKYGEHADDHWEVDDVLALAAQAAGEGRGQFTQVA